MNSLTSKVQYKNYEIGEFSNIAPRSLNDTIALIQNFPWQEERQHFVVSMTNAVVTIEGDNSDYFKIKLYYNNKFIINHLDKNKIFYSKVIISLDEAINEVKAFFTSNVAIDQYKKENIKPKVALTYFETNSFIYKITPKSVRYFFVKSLLLGVIVGILFIGLFIKKAFFESTIPKFDEIIYIIILFLILSIVAVLKLIFYYKFYKFSINKTLQISKGKDEFSYTENGEVYHFNKKDITNITLYRLQGYPPGYKRNSNRVGYFTNYKIQFKNGGAILFPSMIIDELVFKSKFNNIEFIDKQKVAYF